MRKLTEISFTRIEANIRWHSDGLCTDLNAILTKGGADGKMILKWILNETGCEGVDWIH
jgi:hypothetical protein